MKYDLVVEQILKENETVDEAVGAVISGAAKLYTILKWASWLAPVAGLLVTYNKMLPEDWVNMAKENYWYMGFSIFDITGIMSWPYAQMALEKFEQEPNDEWNIFMLIICYLATLPSYSGIGLVAKFSFFLLKKLGAATGKTAAGVTSIYRRFFNFGGRAISKNSKTLGALHFKLVDAYTKNLPNGSNLGVIMRHVLEKGMGIRFDNNKLMKIAAQKKIKLDPKLFKGISAIKTSLAQKALKGAAIIGKGASTLVKPVVVAGTVFNSLSGNDAFSQMMKNRRSSAIPASGIRAVPEFGKIGAKTPAIY